MNNVLYESNVWTHADAEDVKYIHEQDIWNYAAKEITPK